MTTEHSKTQKSSKEETSKKQEVKAPAMQEALTPEAALSMMDLQRAVADPRTARPPEILALQRKYGNDAVQRLLADHGLQAKLTVGAANDSYEQEADRVAAQVMSAPTHTPDVQRQGEEEEEIQAKPLAATITPLVQRQAVPEEEEPLQGKLIQRQGPEDEEELLQGKFIQRQGIPEDEEEPLQGKSISGSRAFSPDADFEGRLAATRGSGSPLPDHTRDFMEQRFETDFRNVRLHTDSEAAKLNRQISAQAFTRGQDVYLGEGKEDINSNEGRRLLAHELTHVVQQGTQLYPKVNGKTESIQRITLKELKEQKEKRKLSQKDIDEQEKKDYEFQVKTKLPASLHKMEDELTKGTASLKKMDKDITEYRKQLNIASPTAKTDLQKKIDDETKKHDELNSYLGNIKGIKNRFSNMLNKINRETNVDKKFEIFLSQFKGTIDYVAPQASAAFENASAYKNVSELFPGFSNKYDAQYDKEKAKATAADKAKGMPGTGDVTNWTSQDGKKHWRTVVPAITLEEDSLTEKELKDWKRQREEKREDLRQGGVDASRAQVVLGRTDDTAKAKNLKGYKALLEVPPITYTLAANDTFMKGGLDLKAEFGLVTPLQDETKEFLKRPGISSKDLYEFAKTKKDSERLLWSDWGGGQPSVSCRELGQLLDDGYKYYEIEDPNTHEKKQIMIPSANQDLLAQIRGPRPALKHVKTKEELNDERMQGMHDWIDEADRDKSIW